MTPNRDKPTIQLSRRRILKICLATSGLLILDGVRRFLGYEAPAKITSLMVLSRPESYPPGSITDVGAARSYILRDTAGLYAMSATCSHLGCQVKQNGRQFDCPCHGSKFAADGTVLAGPAIRPLNHLELHLSPEKRIVLDTTTVVPSTQRLDPEQPTS